METMPFLPEFSNYKERNQWIFNHSDYYTVIRRKHRTYLREERASFEEAEKLAKKLVSKDPSTRCLIYGVYKVHDALLATVSSEGTKRHE